MKNDFAVNVEKLINPVEVGTLHVIQNLTGAFPLNVQRKMVASSGKKTPLMGFVVEPYSTFLNYEIKNVEEAKKLLPKHFKLVKTKITEKDEPKYYGIFGIFNAHTSGFFGLRTEFYIIAEDTRTGLLSWIIIDYDTNTISYDPKHGLTKPNTKKGVFTTDYNGIIHLDMKRDDESRNLIFEADMKDALMTPLDKRLWVEGNLSIGYGGRKEDPNQNVFSIKFHPDEFKEALVLDKSNVQIIENSWFQTLLHDEVESVLVFPYAQHYLSDSPGHFSNLKTEEELLKDIQSVDFNTLNVFETKPIIRGLSAMFILSFFINIALMILLFVLK